MNAEIVSIGDEITAGQTLDTNSQWLSRELESLGVRVLYHTTVGDELDANVEVFRRAADRVDLVIATGGLGPTADDLTREALAKVAAKPLVLDPISLEYIQKLFARRNRPMPQQNEVQAYFPDGARVIENPHGTAPGFAIDLARASGGTCRVVALPGVPAELKEMWAGSVVGILREIGAGQRIVRHRVLRCFGAGESQIESMLPDLIRRGRTPRVGITASHATISLRITAEGADDAECEAIMAPTAEVIRRSLGSLVYGEGDDELQDVVLRQLAERRQTVATVEGGTAGLLAHWLAAAELNGPFLGGIVQPNASPVVSKAANAAQVQFGADFAIAVGPFPASDAVEGSATVAIAAVGPGMAETKFIPYSLHPAIRRAFCAKWALNLLRLALDGQS